MNNDHLIKGQKAEDMAEAFLQTQGLVSLIKNFKCKSGEIDLIMKEKDVMVFVEVRLRTNPFFTHAAESVNYNKQRKLINTARFYLQQSGLSDKVACRFDVIALDNNHKITESAWIKNAFGA